MATAGDRMFGPNGCSGITAGNGTIVNVPLDFSPQYVIAINASYNGMMFWFKGMDPGWGWIIKGFGQSNQAQTESVAVIANVGVLGDSPSVVTSVYVDAGGVTGVFQILPTGATLTTGTVLVNYSTRELTFFAADAVTNALVSYLVDTANVSIIDFTNSTGVSPGSEGFSIGANTFINNAGQNIYWLAGR